jgi:caffeoyl-CoA O-methyltransferase
MTPEEYARDLLGDDPLLDRIVRRSVEAGLPEISIAPVYGRLLTLLAAFSGARRALEIGTLGGYGAACLARGLGDSGRVLTIERDARHAATARENLGEAGLGHRVEVRVGEADQVLRSLEEANERFGLIFIDADKEGYPRYLRTALRLAEPGALIAADNALFHGSVLDADDQGAPAAAVREYTRLAFTDPRLTSVVLPAYDGLIVSRVRD